MDREKAKLCDKLESQISGPMLPEAYDREEQLTFLVQFAHGQPVQSTGRVKLNGSDHAKYQSMVKAYIPEHPFIRNKEFGNTILGSVVVAHAITHDLLKSGALDSAARVSNQPFLWRAFSQRAPNNLMIDGRYVGYILNSLWNDPIQSKSDRHIAIDRADENVATVSILHNKRRAFTFSAKMPVTFYAQIRDCEVELSDKVLLLGEGPSSGTAFYGRGTSIIMCQAMDVHAASIRLEGNIWLEAEEVSTPPQFQIFVKNGAKVGWGRNLANRYPWNEIEQTLDQPYEEEVPDDDPLIALAIGLARRLPGSTPLVLAQSYTPVPGDPLTRWAARRFSSELAELIQTLVKHGMASTEALDASGSDRKVRVRVNFAWWDLLTALQNPHSGEWAKFIAEVRSRI
jgi:hypothetical protein